MLDNVHPYLSRAVYVFIVTLVFVIGMASFSYVYMDSAREDMMDAKRAMKIWKNRVSSSRHNNSIIDAYESEYLQLINHGVIGKEDRLSWYEAIQATSESRGMPSVKYSVSSQTQLDKRAVAKAFKGLDLYRSTMTMDIKMGHEGDLFAMLNNLQEKANGLFLVDKCDVERAGSDLKHSTAASTNNMKAYCELSWYTIRATKSKKAKG